MRNTTALRLCLPSLLVKVVVIFLLNDKYRYHAVQWYTAIGDNVLAEAILDNAYRLPLKGESIRKEEAID